MLTSKETRIIQVLCANRGPLTSKELASMLGYSVRNIKTYIKNINSEFPNTIITSRKGYYLSETYSAALPPRTVVPQSAEERKLFMFRNLLLEGEAFELDELASFLCISTETLIREIRLFNQDLVTDHLKITYTNDYVTIEGSEKNKRAAISRFISEDVKSAVFSYETLQKYFPSYQIDRFYEEMVKSLKKAGFYLDDFSIFNLLLHIIIVANRSELDMTIANESEDNLPDFVIPNKINALIHEFEEAFSKINSIKLSAEDHRELALLLVTRLTDDDETKNTLDAIFENSSPDITALIEEIDNYIKKVYNIEIFDDQAKMRFFIHIKNLCLRIKKNISISNPMINEARKHFYIFDIAISIGKIIENRFQCVLSEDEISYIAIHLIFSISQNVEQEDRLSVLVMCPNYSNIQEQLCSKLKTIFPTEIGTIDVLGYHRQIQESKYDLILSTFENQNTPVEDYVIIDPRLKPSDISKISQRIEQIKTEKGRRKFMANMNSFFRPEFFFLEDYQMSDMDSLLTKVCRALFQNQYVSEDYKDHLILREHQYPTTFGEVALPHPINYDSIRSTIAVGINKKGIKWSNNKTVKVILVLAFRKDDQASFTEILDYLSEFLLDAEYIKSLSKVASYEEFIHLLCGNYLSSQKSIS